MILEYIERLRQQPAEVRRQAVGVWTVVVVVGIVVLYLLILALQAWIFSDSSDVGDPLVAPYSEQNTPEN